MTHENALGTSSAQPDLGWSQLRETILMINLAVAQIDHSMHEGTQSVNTLADSFTLLADIMNDIKSSLHQLPEGHNKDKLALSTETASANIATAIMAFQFYDKLSQRLGHVSKDLNHLIQLISNPECLYSPPKWKQLQETIREQYTMEEERVMFDKVLSGVPIEQAILEFSEDLNNNNNDKDGDIELF